MTIYHNAKAFVGVLPDLTIMVVVSSIDFLLNVAGQKKQLEVSQSYDDEMYIAGVANGIQALLLAPTGYVQLKFTMINHALIDETDSIVPGMCLQLPLRKDGITALKLKLTIKVGQMQVLFASSSTLLCTFRDFPL